jgi:hypothetical protein
MQVTLTEDHLWRGQTYPAGDREIPNELAIALGFAVEVSAPAVLTPEPLLAALNDAELADELVYLPTIGKSAAALLVLNRPWAGYESLEQVRKLNQKLVQKPFRVDWAVVAEFVEKSATVADLEG